MSSQSGGLMSSLNLKSNAASGFLVFLIALPLCLGISMASGFPPVAGVLTAIVGGVIVTLLGSSPLTIKGPAAGLIVIALGAVQELGQGDAMTGYRRALAVGAMAAALQIIFALVRAASVGVAMSPSVVHGMLAAIGVIIVSKQAHTAMGVGPHSKEPLELLAEIPNSIAHMNPEIAIIGVVSLIILFGLPMIRSAWVKKIPAPIVVLLVAVPLGVAFDLADEHVYTMVGHDYHVGPNFLVQLPGNLLSAVQFPDFSVAFTAASFKYTVMFALVGTIESTLSVIAVDAMDPKKRASNLDRDMLAVGVGNLICALIGGLPMISEIVRSKANIDAGAQGRASNFFHGLYLLLFVALAPTLLQKIPLAALAAMLIYTGARLASPSEFKHAMHLGRDQFFLFLATMLVTLATDLLIGVAVGIVLKFVLHLLRGVRIGDLFRPRIEREDTDEEITLILHGAATFTNLLSVRKNLRNLSSTITRVTIDLRNVKLVDHTFQKRLAAMSDEWETTELVLIGADSMRAFSHHPHASKVRT